MKGTHGALTSGESAADEAAYELVGDVVLAITDLLDRHPTLGAPSATTRVAVKQ